MQTQRLKLPEVVTHVLDECRMVLPGIQALFGFQLIAVFNQRFAALSRELQFAHLAATGCVAISAGLVMTPAAYHRIVHPDEVSERLVRISTVLLLTSMALLGLGVSTDFYMISFMISGSSIISTCAALGILCVLYSLWYLFPGIERRFTSRSAPGSGR